MSVTDRHSGQLRSVVSWVGRFLGPILGISVYVWLQYSAPELPHPPRVTAAIGVLIAVYWITEALPLPVTALFPLVFFPIAGVYADLESPMKLAAAPYASRYIFLFMGGFMIALAIERWNLHRRLALLTVLIVGTKPTHLVGGFMIATSFLSMWLSNTATTLMMLPIGLSVVALLTEESSLRGTSEGNRNFSVCLMLCIAYAANIGGMATLVGTPPNIFLAGFLTDYSDGIELGFARWMLVAGPLVVLFLGITWWLLTHVIFPIQIQSIPGGRTLIRGELKKLGVMSRPEWTVLVVFVMTALGLVLREPVSSWAESNSALFWLSDVNDTTIALTGALLLFLIPVNRKADVFALDWETAKELPWGVLLLFGGGLSLSNAVTSTHLNDWIGEGVTNIGFATVLSLTVFVTVLVIVLTELTSNIATVSAFLPVLASVAEGMGIPVLLLLLPATWAASCAFMLPVATPPNAIVFGSGHVRIGEMLKAGFILNVVGTVLILLTLYLLGRPILISG
ncbi:MAG: DASS family sodium-coupled anion symporter [Planctomycetota bacterium]|nr:DASS family sodium-coupled anion symporter [Planctomycetota bacterium]